MLKALDQLKMLAPDNLKQVLLGQRAPTPRQELSNIDFFDDTLNDSQKDAVRFALEANEVALVHGPPGKI